MLLLTLLLTMSGSGRFMHHNGDEVRHGVEATSALNLSDGCTHCDKVRAPLTGSSCATMSFCMLGLVTQDGVVETPALAGPPMPLTALMSGQTTRPKPMPPKAQDLV